MHSMKYQPKELVITKFSRGAESLETVLKNRGGKKKHKMTHLGRDSLRQELFYDFSRSFYYLQNLIDHDLLVHLTARLAFVRTEQKKIPTFFFRAGSGRRQTFWYIMLIKGI